MAHEKYDRLIAAVKDIPPVPTAVAHPCDVTSLSGAVDAAQAGIIVPILVGPEQSQGTETACAPDGCAV
jgi:hypothetical protein